MTVVKRIGIAAAGLLTTGALLAPAVLGVGSISCTISGNGTGSTNRCRINVSSSSAINQVNNATVRNRIRVNSNTGGNTANNNTGTSSATINTGSSSVNITITNTVNSNSVGP
jgi:hypothetical protein